MAGERYRNIPPLDLAGGEGALHGVHDQAGVHDGAVHDRLGREPLQRHVQKLVAAVLAELLQLDDLDGARADVEPHQILSL